MKIDEEIGARLMSLRQARKLTRDQLAETLGEGFTKPTIQAHENGRNALKPHSIMKYLDFYGVDANWLLTGRGSPQGFDAEARRVLDKMDKDTRELWIKLGKKMIGQK